MTIDDKIRDEKLQYDINREAEKNLEKLLNMNILQVKKYCEVWAKFAYSSLGIGWCYKVFRHS